MTLLSQGNFIGVNNVRANISQNKVNKLPSKAETGTSSRLSYPIRNLAPWGTIRPTKPNRPAKLTALPASNDDNMNINDILPHLILKT